MVGNVPGFPPKNILSRWLNTGELAYLGYVYYLPVSELTVIFSQDPNITKNKTQIECTLFSIYTLCDTLNNYKKNRGLRNIFYYTLYIRSLETA